MTSGNPRPTAGQAINALFLGGVTGAALVALWFGLSGGFSGRPVGEPPPGFLEGFVGSLPVMLFAVFPAALFIWLFGLFVFATPGWWLLHRIRLRSLPIAMIYGFLLSSLTVWLFMGGPGSGDRSGPVLGAAASVGAVGAAVGAVVWRVAYWGGTQGR